MRFKGPERSIKAFELACERGLRGRLVLAGDGPLLAECRQLVSQSRFGHLIDIRGTIDWDEGLRLRREADVYTQHNVEDPDTGQVEAYGVAVVEAMAEALPVVGTRSGGVVETVVDGETGVLVAPGDMDGQARAFLRLASAPEERTRLGKAGWIRAGRDSGGAGGSVASPDHGLDR